MSFIEHRKGDLPPMDPQCHRIGVLVVTFLAAFWVIFSGVTIYALGRTPMYKSMATLEVIRGPNDSTLNIPANAVVEVLSFSDRARALESNTLVKSVADRLTSEQQRRILLPYEGMLTMGHPKSIEDILTEGRVVTSDPNRLRIAVGFIHSNAEMASLVSNLYADAFIQAKASVETANTQLMIDDLNARARILHGKLEADQALIAQSLKKIADLKAQGLDTTQAQVNLDVLSQQTKAASEAYLSVSASVVDWQAKLSQKPTESVYRIVEPAIPALDPEGPATSLLIWSGLGAGLVGGALAAALVAGTMAFRRLPQHLPSIHGLSV
jgi:uncharacterized protein involved in exopolysaccharide biosynthesis